MVNRPTQSPEYWSAFILTNEDADFVYSTLVEYGKPRSSSDIARELIARRVELENISLRRELERGTIYQPKKSFAIDEEIVMPAVFSSGKVLSKRAGNNAELGAFDVYTIEFRDGTRREFVGGYVSEHALNDDEHVSRLLNQESEVQSPEVLFSQYVEQVLARLDQGLESRSPFIRVAQDWFLRELMADVNPGHLNLAEAVLDMAGGGPLPTHIILRDLGLPEEVTNALQEVSLNGALAMDDRFDEVSVTGEPAWFLRKLEPKEVRSKPPQLDGDLRAEGEVDEAHQTIARNIDDELEFDATQPIEQTDSATIILTFPHRRAGTLGWGRKLAGVLPECSKPRIPIILKDRANGKQFTVWLVKEGRYIWGLGEWFRNNDIPPGAEIEIVRTAQAGQYTIDAKRHKPRREWVRHASLRGSRVHLETVQKPTSCAVDDLFAVYVDDIRALDVLATGSRELPALVKELFPEIAKLSPQGNVNVRTLYAVTNIITRVSPRNVMAALGAVGGFVHMGDGYWHLGEKAG